MEVNGRRRTLLGSAACYGWHRDGVHCPDLVVSALMALEKHVYDQIDAGAGEAILTRLTEALNTVAVLGTLVTVGKRNPEMFADMLRFAHFSHKVQGWDIEQTVGGEGHQMIPWTGEGEPAVKRAQEWHAAPYRRTPLKYFAFYVINDPEGRQDAHRACARWKRLSSRCSDELKGSLENLAVVYDASSYSVEPHEKGVVDRKSVV